MNKLSPLASITATREILKAHGLATKKALGQHFLINDGIISRMCDLSGITTEDTVLEVGPGIGTLTLALLKKARRVVSVERDKDLPQVLADTCKSYPSTFALISKDALALTEADLIQALETLPHPETKRDALLPNLFIANLPYAVAATIILDFFEKFTSLQSATIMVQSEVADRICAKPGTKAYGAYTVKLSLYTQAVGRFTVGPQNFFPPPRVDSAVVRLDRCPRYDENGSALATATVKAACIMADAAFANRRKTILNSCKTYFIAQGSKGERIVSHLPKILEEAGIDNRLRGEVLESADFIALGRALEKICEEIL